MLFRSKLFQHMKESNQGQGDDRYWDPCGSCGRLLIIYGIGDAYECASFSSKFKKFKVNDVYVYVSSDEAIIPANVAGIQKVKSVRSEERRVGKECKSRGSPDQ